MNKKIIKSIKIGLIAVAVIAIAGVSIYFLKGITEPPKTVIASTSFEKEIEQEVNNKIKGQEFAVAAAAYDDVLAKITTEASIKNTDGTTQLTPDEVTNCKKLAFYAYAPIYLQHAKEFFANSSWSEPEMKQLAAQAQSLLSANIAQGQTQSDLAAVGKTVSDYYAAWRVVRSAGSCGSVAAVNAVRSQAASYSHAPLTNNASLKAGLAGAFGQAKRAYAQKIENYCSRVEQSYTRYPHTMDGYKSWCHEADNANAQVNAYNQAFGGNLNLVDRQSDAVFYYFNSSSSE